MRTDAGITLRSAAEEKGEACTVHPSFSGSRTAHRAHIHQRAAASSHPGGSDRHLPGRWPGVSVHPAPGASRAITLLTDRKGPTGLLYRLSWDKFFLRFPWSLELEREGVQPRIDKLGSEVVWDFANFEIKL